MKLLSWNIRSGGGQRCGQIAKAVASHDADVVVLTEYRPKSSFPLLAELGAQGYGHLPLGDADPRIGGVEIFSRRPLVEESPLAFPGAFASRFRIACIAEADLRVCGIYGPLRSDAYDECWRGALDNLKEQARFPTIVMGDFNTGAPMLDSPGPRFLCSEYFAELSKLGYVDLWRNERHVAEQEWTWQGRANPYRIDHAFGSRFVLPRVRRCWYSHAEREQKISDHSIVLVELVDPSR